jgi:hypothetical protein
MAVDSTPRRPFDVPQPVPAGPRYGDWNRSSLAAADLGKPLRASGGVSDMQTPAKASVDGVIDVVIRAVACRTAARPGGRRTPGKAGPPVVGQCRTVPSPSPARAGGGPLSPDDIPNWNVSLGGAPRRRLSEIVILPVDFDWALFDASCIVLSGEVGSEKARAQPRLAAGGAWLLTAQPATPERARRSLPGARGQDREAVAGSRPARTISHVRLHAGLGGRRPTSFRAATSRARSRCARC